MNVSFARWHGKNLSAIASLGNKWEIAAAHVVRSSTYKGENEVATLPGFRYDAVSTLGLFQLLGCLAQVRGLAGGTQHKMLEVMRDALRTSEWPTGLSFLRDTIFHVEEGKTSMREWLNTLPKQEKNMVKTRRLFCDPVPHNLRILSFVLADLFPFLNSTTCGLMSFRWENTLALGPARHNCNASFLVAELLFFWLRQPSGSIGTIDVDRIQKRLVHLCAQAVELAFHANRFPLSTQPPALLANDTQAQGNWTATKTRSQAAEELRVELLRRFMAKNTGFVSGIKHQDNKDLHGLHSSGGSNAGMAIEAAAQMCTAYFLKASAAVMDKLASQKFKHVACYYDSASVCHFSVQELHLSCDGLVVSAPLSLIPQLKQPFEQTSEQCLAAIQDIDIHGPLHQISKKDPETKKLSGFAKDNPTLSLGSSCALRRRMS